MFLTQFVIIDFRDNNPNIPRRKKEHKLWLNLVHLQQPDGLALAKTDALQQIVVFSQLCSFNSMVN